MHRPINEHVGHHDLKSQLMHAEALAIIKTIEARLDELEQVEEARATVLQLRSVLTELWAFLGVGP